jgi:hypothetical protein
MPQDRSSSNGAESATVTADHNDVDELVEAGRPVRVYRMACAHSDVTIAGFDLNSPAHVAHGAECHQQTTLGVLLVPIVTETAQHAGHADIIRELIDGRIGAGGSAHVVRMFQPRRGRHRPWEDNSMPESLHAMAAGDVVILRVTGQRLSKRGYAVSMR